jgi:hypothetical protein
VIKRLLLIPAGIIIIWILADYQENKNMNSPLLNAAERGEIPQIDKVKHKRSETAVFAMG